MDAAPELVQACYARLVSPHPGQVHLLHQDNLAEYVSIPDYIMQKVKKGQITYTHFSDIVRVNLLAEYGGIWIDSTCWCAQPIPPPNQTI